MNETNTETWKIGEKSRGTRVKYNDLRNNPVPMNEKRRLREVRQSEGYNPSFWTQKHYSCVWPYWSKGKQVISIFKLWGKTLIAIRAKFGSSISSYFLFLRFLLLLNLASLILTTGFIIVPTILLSKTEHNHSYLAPCGNSSAFPSQSLQSTVLDLFTGEGFMQDTFLFYGHYGNVVGLDDSFSVRLSYLLTPFVFLLICSLLLLQRYEPFNAYFWV